MAYGTNTDVITYHMSNRRSMEVDFFTAQSVTSNYYKQRQIRLAHGIGMIIAWRYILRFTVYWINLQLYQLFAYLPPMTVLFSPYLFS